MCIARFVFLGGYSCYRASNTGCVRIMGVCASSQRYFPVFSCFRHYSILSGNLAENLFFSDDVYLSWRISWVVHLF